MLAAVAAAAAKDGTLHAASLCCPHPLRSIHGLMEDGYQGEGMMPLGSIGLPY